MFQDVLHQVRLQPVVFGFRSDLVIVCMSTEIFFFFNRKDARLYNSNNPFFRSKFFIQ